MFDGNQSVEIIKNTIQARFSEELKENGKGIVVKPSNSSDSDCVNAFSDAQEAAQAVKTLLDKENLLSNKNEVVVVQEKLIGPETMVETYADHEGNALCFAIWDSHKYGKNGQSFIYDYMELAHPSEEDLDTMISTDQEYCYNPSDSMLVALAKYTFYIKKILEVSHSLAHTEIIFDAERGPVILETGIRLSGIDMHNKFATGVSGAEIETRHFNNPDLKENNKISYTAHHECTNIVSLCSPYDNYSINQVIKSQIEALETYQNNPDISYIKAQSGKSISFKNVPGLVVLAGSKEQVAQDRERIRALEKQLYVQNSVEEISTIV